MASMAAGKSGATSNVSPSIFHRFGNIRFMRSLIKTFSLRANPGLHGGPNRHFRMFLKFGFWCYMASLSNTLLNKYKLVEWQANCFQNGDKRWDNCPSPWINNKEDRKLAWEPTLILNDDPWTVYREAYNSIPWEQVTKYDDPDVEAGWNAFGSALPGNQLFTGIGGHSADTMQKNKPYAVMAQQADFTNYPMYWTYHTMDAFRLWAKDIYYNYYYVFFHVPLEERFESLGQSSGRRIARRWYMNQGPGSIRGADWINGALHFLYPNTFYG